MNAFAARPHVVLVSPRLVSQVTIAVHRHRFGRPKAGQNLSHYDPHFHAPEGIDQ